MPCFLMIKKYIRFLKHGSLWYQVKINHIISRLYQMGPAPYIRWIITHCGNCSSLIPFSDGRKIRTVYGEAERRTLLNLVQAIDKDQVLLSPNKSDPVKIMKLQLWKQVTDSFNDITGKNASMQKLFSTLKRMKLHKGAKYLQYDEDTEKWIFLWPLQ